MKFHDLIFQIVNTTIVDNNIMRVTQSLLPADLDIDYTPCLLFTRLVPPGDARYL